MKPFYFAKRKLQVIPAATILVVLAISIPLSAQTITTFDAPGAGTGALQGTSALDIDPSGRTIGFFRDANNVRHGFSRSKDGTFTIFDAPGAGTAANQGTRAYATNSSGSITGHFTDSSNVAHGYVRSNQGVITVFDAPGAGTGAGQGTFPFNSPNLINPEGAITGYYVDSAGAWHGFLRDANGLITTFDVPNGGTGFHQGTYGGGFAPDGSILGVLIDASTVNHGFLLNKDGTVTTFDAPDAGSGFDQGTLPWGVNTNGAITGWYVDNAY